MLKSGWVILQSVCLLHLSCLVKAKLQICSSYKTNYSYRNVELTMSERKVESLTPIQCFSGCTDQGSEMRRMLQGEWRLISVWFQDDFSCYHDHIRQTIKFHQMHLDCTRT